MIFDNTLLFSDNQAVTATAPSTNVVDLGAAPNGRDIGPGTPIPLAVIVTEDFAGLTSLTISIQVDDNAAFSSPKTVYTTVAYPLTDLVVGKRFLLPEYVPTGTNERYMRLNYTVAGTGTAGTITAGVVAARQTA